MRRAWKRTNRYIHWTISSKRGANEINFKLYHNLNTFPQVPNIHRRRSRYRRRSLSCSPLRFTSCRPETAVVSDFQLCSACRRMAIICYAYAQSSKGVPLDQGGIFPGGGHGPDSHLARALPVYTNCKSTLDIFLPFIYLIPIRSHMMLTCG